MAIKAALLAELRDTSYLLAAGTIQRRQGVEAQKVKPRGCPVPQIAIGTGSHYEINCRTCGLLSDPGASRFRRTTGRWPRGIESAGAGTIRSSDCRSAARMIPPI